MKKLRLNKAERKKLINDIEFKLTKACSGVISEFNYTQKDVNEFLKELTHDNVKMPTIQISSAAYVKMLELVKESTTEIQWHGLVEKFDDHYIILDHILVFPQINSGAATTSNQNEFAKWQMELIKDETFPIEKMRLHGHSHVNMNVYSSAIDDGYQTDLITKVDDNDFYIFLVMNKKMEVYPLIYDFEQQILFEGDDIKIQIIDNTGTDIIDWAKEEIKDNCTTGWKTTKPTITHTPIYNGCRYSENDDYDDYIADIVQQPRYNSRRKK